MKVQQVMTRDVISIEPSASLLEAARLMLQHKISGLPVIDANRHLVGILTEGDFLRRSELGTQHKGPRWLEFLAGPGQLASEYVHASSRKVQDVMTAEVRTISEDTLLEQAVELMERYHVKRLPVVRGPELVGIVTRANLMRAVVARAVHAEPAATDDASIRAALVAELKHQPWAPLAVVDVTVKDGVLRYTGCITDERQRDAMKVAAENIPGVKKVEDELVWIEPSSGMVIEGTKH